jgi:Mg-chelatase subunit ChlD
MNIFRTSSPETYIPPNLEEIRAKAAEMQLSSYSPTFVGDLANIAAGGKINPPSKYAGILEGMVREKIPAPDIHGRYVYGNITYVSKDELFTKIFSAEKKFHQNVCDFLQTINFDKFDGSPLEKAIGVLKLLSTKQGGTPGSGGDDCLPIFNQASPEQIAQEINSTIEMVERLNQDEIEMLDPDSQNHKIVNGNFELNKLKVAQDMMPGSKNRTILEISRHLDNFTKLQVRKQKKVSPDPTGEEKRNRPMLHMGEINKVVKTTWADKVANPTLFSYKIATNQYVVTERVTRIEKKQAIFILVDGSGSMKGSKHFKATGVVMNRLKAVLSGDAQVWISVFSDSMSTPKHASTPDEARKLIKEFSSGNFVGGGTQIAKAVQAAHDFIQKQIKSGASLYKPEIVILTDEDNSITGLKKSQIPGTRVHGFAMERKNSSLVDFCKSTSGIGIENF